VGGEGVEGYVIHYRSGYEYQLVADYSVQTPITPSEQIITKFISLRADGLLFIAESYAWDGFFLDAWSKEV